MLFRSRLKTDGEFGNKTLKAVMYFQSENWLQIDGVAGPCTWNALTGEETYNVLHPIRLVPQPTCTTCWAASTAMLLGQHRAVTVPPALESLLTADGSLLNDSELNNPVNMLQYCSYYHLKLRFPQSYTPDGLYSVLKNKPAMCNIL